MLSQYEQVRLANIARNKEKLASLGIEKIQSRGTKKKPRKRIFEDVGPARRSTRVEKVTEVRAQIQLILDQEEDLDKIIRSSIIKSTRQRNRDLKRERENLAAMRIEESEQRQVENLIVRETERKKRIEQKKLKAQRKEDAKRIKQEKAHQRCIVVFRVNQLKKSEHTIKLKYNEYDVHLVTGAHGLCIDLGIHDRSIKVDGFRTPQPNVVGPAEACGLISIGDELLAINGDRLKDAEDFKRFVSFLKYCTRVTLRFRHITLK